MEILAPAGSPESLTAAIYCGADAVYLGGAGLLNARRNAKGFDRTQLGEAVSFCHGRGAKVYLTLNTLIRESEQNLLLDALEYACSIGVDAVLVQDLAVAAAIRAACPQLPMHASTQMSVTSAEGVMQLEELGFSRVVLGRELSLGEITQIRKSTSLELEAFVHGALCMSVSGQCYLSSIIGARSGNRGLCAQPCRLPFACGDSTHALSLRDLSLLNRLEELSAAGVCCVKIEGRMKRPEYVAAAVTACVSAREGREYDADELAAVFSRSGFTQGYLDGRRNNAMFGIRQKEDVTAATSKLLKSYENLYRKESPRVPLKFHLAMEQDKPPVLTVTDADGLTTTVTGTESVQKALTAPTTSERAEAALSKTGGTPFYAAEITCDIGPEAMLPASALNDLRRRALEQHLTLREHLSPIPFAREEAKSVWNSLQIKNTPAARLGFRVRLGRADQLKSALDSDCGMIILPEHLWDTANKDLLKQALPRLAVELPICTFGEDTALSRHLEEIRETGVRDAVVGSLGAIHEARRLDFRLHGDAALNLFNAPAVKSYAEMELHSATLSYELTLREAVSAAGSIPAGILAYGYLPLMRLRNCPARAHGLRCTGRDCGYPTLTDRMDKEFFLDCDGRVSTLYNCVPLWMADRLNELRGLDFCTIYLTKESPGEAAQILDAFAQEEKPLSEHTRGLYYRAENTETKKR